jgi:flagellar biosynthesis protein FlhF
MRLRVFRAPGMADAMARLRSELGADAIILATRRIAGGVEVTAALEPPPAYPSDAPGQAHSAEVEPPEPLLIEPEAGGTAFAPGPARLDGNGQPALARHNLPRALASRLDGAGPEVIAAVLSRLLAFGPVPQGAPRPLLLVGPPGAGKTVTSAKLAARHVQAGRRPLVISTDHARAGAAAQLAAFTRLLGLVLALAEAPGTLVKALAHAAPGQPVLIDTEGCDPFDPDQARALLELVRAADAEVALVLPGGVDADEASELARGFALLGARQLIPTRLDQARRLGGVLAAAAAADLVLGEAGTGPGAAGGLTQMTPEWLAQRLLGAGMGRQGVAA